MTLKQSQNGRGSQDNTSRSPENIDLEFAQTPTIPNLISQVMPGNMMSISTAMALQRTVGNRQTHQLLTPLSAQTPTIQREGDGEGLHEDSKRLTIAEIALKTAHPGELLPSASDFVTPLMKKINKYLEGEGVKAVLARQQLPKNRQPNELGEFDAASWSIVYNPDVKLSEVQDGKLNLSGYDNLADTIYHEARHAEQFFKMMQLLAYHGLNEDAISRVTTMGDKVHNAHAISDAIKNKKAVESWSQTTLSNVKSWYNAVYDMTFDQAVAKYNNTQGSQTKRFDGERAERKRLGARKQNSGSLVEMFEGIHATPSKLKSGEDFSKALNVLANELGAPYPLLFNTLIQEGALKDFKMIRLVAQKILDQIKVDKETYDEAHDQYKNYAHEKDAYAAGDSISRVLTYMREADVTPPPLPSEMNVENWRKAIEINSGFFNKNNQGGDNIKQITKALEGVAVAHAQAVQQKNLSPLYRPLLSLQTALKTWLNIKKAKKGENLKNRYTAANVLLFKVVTYLKSIGFTLERIKAVNNSQ